MLDVSTVASIIWLFATCLTCSVVFKENELFFTLNSSNWYSAVVSNVLGMPDAYSIPLQNSGAAKAKALRTPNGFTLGSVNAYTRAEEFSEVCVDPREIPICFLGWPCDSGQVLPQGDITFWSVSSGTQKLRKLGHSHTSYNSKAGEVFALGLSFRIFFVFWEAVLKWIEFWEAELRSEAENFSLKLVLIFRLYK